MMKLIRSTVCLLCCLSPLTWADIYRSDEDGTPSFSDRPSQPNSEKVELPEANVTPSVSPQHPPSSKTSSAKTPTLTLLSPLDGDTIAIGQPTLTVMLDLGEANTHTTLVILLDGQEIYRDQPAVQLELPKPTRGPHSLSAQLLGRNGHPLATTATHTFQVLAPSAKAPNR